MARDWGIFDTNVWSFSEYEGVNGRTESGNAFNGEDIKRGRNELTPSKKINHWSKKISKTQVKASKSSGSLTFSAN